MWSTLPQRSMVLPTETGASSSSRTNWAMIFDAARGGDQHAADALEQLVRRYWPAVYAYIRRSGRDVHETADLTQGFVCDVILGRHLFAHADPKRGRFRTLLLSALQNYLQERHRHDTRAKRSPAGKPLHFDDTQVAAAESHMNLSPEQAFIAQWNATVVRRVLERVRNDCLTKGLEAHWCVFEARVARPMLLGEKRVPYSRLIERLELSDAGQAANMMTTVKRRFVQALLEEITNTVRDPTQVEDEIRSLLRDLELQP